MNPYITATTPVPVSPIVGHATPFPQTTPQQAAAIQPGSITYTTTVGPDGQVVYHPFKAVAASYQTAQGVVNGIQWIPAEATSVLPTGATPADSAFNASFGRRPEDKSWRGDEYRRRDEDPRRSPKYDRDGRRYDDDDYYRRDHDRGEDREYRRARGHDERDRERRLSGYGRYPGEYDKYATADLERRMENLDIERRERDLQRERDHEYDRERERERERDGVRRRSSFYGGGERPTSTYQTAPGGNYPSTYATATTNTYTAAPGGNYPTSANYRAASPRPLDRPVSPYRNPVAVPRPVSPYHAGALPAAPRPVSPYQVPGAVPRAVSPFQAGAIHRAASPYGGPAPLARAASPYGGGAIPPRAASPYHGASSAAAVGMYPSGHVFEGQPIRGGSRAPSPSPYAPPINLYANPNASYGATGGQAPYGAAPYGSGIGSHASPRIGAIPLDAAAQAQQMLTVPEGFGRPPNRAQSYTQFEMMKIGDMDDLLDHMPRMPAVLMPHDIYHEDWIRLMTDLGLAWTGTMPVPQYSPDGRPPKRSTLAADVVDLWNASFFRLRGVEMILYKGRERRSGRYSGTVDMNLPGFDKFDVSSPSESDDDDDDLEGDRYRDRYGGGGYGREADARRRKERKAERRRRKLEKKIKKRQKEMERAYAIYLQCVPPTDM